MEHVVQSIYLWVSCNVGYGSRISSTWFSKGKVRGAFLQTRGKVFTPPILAQAYLRAVLSCLFGVSCEYNNLLGGLMTVRWTSTVLWCSSCIECLVTYQFMAKPACYLAGQTLMAHAVVWPA